MEFPLFYLVGGWGNNDNKKSFLVYDFELDEWSELKEMNKKR